MEPEMNEVRNTNELRLMMNTRTPIHLDTRTVGHSDTQTFGHSGSCTNHK